MTPAARSRPGGAGDDPGAAAIAQASAPRCRNCGADAGGNYCPSCGQETTVALPSAGRFLREAAGRYIAFDGRFWRSLHGLLFRPGFLTREYLAGRRRRYVRPARLFVALSIALFAILQFSADAPVVIDTAAPRDQDAPGRDGVAFGTAGLDVDRDLLRLDVRAWPQLAPLRSRVDAFNRLPREQKIERLRAGVLRYAPYAAIGLLPVFALLLKIAYAGRSGRHPARPRQYAAHLVFGAHNHAFVFLTASLMALIAVGAVRATLAVWMLIYALASMKTVYGGSWLGIVLRGLFIGIVYAVFFVVAVVGLLIAAVALR